MEKILKAIRKHWIRIWLVCAVLLSLSLAIAYAAYTEVNSVKRVVSTTSSAGSLFSSNCMRPDVPPMRRMHSTTYPVTVCNFDQEKTTIFNTSNIDYTFKATLCVKDETAPGGYSSLSAYLAAHPELADDKITAINAKAEKYKVVKSSDDEAGTLSNTPAAFTSDNNYQTTFSGESLVGGHSSSDEYKVEIDPVDIDPDDINDSDKEHYFVLVEATSTTHGTLSAYLYGTPEVSETANWTGELVEDENDNYYDFYNYVILGSGAGTVEIMWDGNYLEINPFFLDTTISGNRFDTTVTTVTDGIASPGTVDREDSHNGWNTVTLIVDSRTKSRYELQLYKKQALTSASNYIYCKYNPPDV